MEMEEGERIRKDTEGNGRRGKDMEGYGRKWSDREVPGRQGRGRVSSVRIWWDKTGQDRISDQSRGKGGASNRDDRIGYNRYD